MAKKNTILTTSFGLPLSDDRNSLTAGNPGPVLMQEERARATAG